MSLVLDSSATLAWIYDDEAPDPIRSVWERIADAGAVVPALWRLEVANSLTVAGQRNRIDTGFRQSALADLAALDITIDQQTDAQAWTDTFTLADRHRLTLYDAAYLELAQRRRLPLTWSCWPRRRRPACRPWEIEVVMTSARCGRSYEAADGRTTEGGSTLNGVCRKANDRLMRKLCEHDRTLTGKD